MAEHPRFSTISNSGARDGYTNSCLWISIQDYLRDVLRSGISLRALRDMGGVRPEERNTQFDSGIARHSDGITRIANNFDLTIYIYSSDRNNRLILSDFYGDGRNIVYIRSFGRHFQLIDSFPEIGYRIDVRGHRSYENTVVYDERGKGYINLSELEQEISRKERSQEDTSLELAIMASLQDQIERNMEIKDTKKEKISEQRIKLLRDVIYEMDEIWFRLKKIKTIKELQEHLHNLQLLSAKEESLIEMDGFCQYCTNTIGNTEICSNYSIEGRKYCEKHIKYEEVLNRIQTSDYLVIGAGYSKGSEYDDLEGAFRNYVAIGSSFEDNVFPQHPLLSDIGGGGDDECSAFRNIETTIYFLQSERKKKKFRTVFIDRCVQNYMVTTIPHPVHGFRPDGTPNGIIKYVLDPESAGIAFIESLVEEEGDILFNNKIDEDVLDELKRLFPKARIRDNLNLRR